MVKIYDFFKYCEGLKMTTDQVIDIESLAQDILDENAMTVPVDPFELAKTLGIKVFEMDLSKWDSSGLITKQDGITEIYINESEKETRKRFTLSHELGHLYLHMDGEEEMEFLDSVVYGRGTGDFSTDRNKEREANQFAAALLMPANDVKKEWRTCYSLSKMSMKFLVSPQAMEIRLKHLGLV